MLILDNASLKADTNDDECVEISCQMEDNGHKGPKTHAPAKRLKLFKSGQNIYVCSADIGVDAVQVQLFDIQGTVVSSDYVSVKVEEYTPCCYIGDLEAGTYIIKVGVGSLTFEGQFEI